MTCLRSLLLPFSVALLLSCGGAGDVTDPLPVSPAWVTIDPPASQTTVCNEVQLTGDAFISPTLWHCCGGTAAGMTAVTVTWRNETTGDAGSAIQSVQTGLVVPLFDHEWTATVPLAPGSNALTVTATDTAGQSAKARIAIDKTGPSYGLSGRVWTDGGVWGIGHRDSGARVAIAGPVNTIALPASGLAQGGYAATCLPPGRYTVTPASSALAFAFQPASRTVDIVAADVTNVDFVAPAHSLAGQVTWAISGLPATAELMTLTGGAAALVRGVDSTGEYRFVVPDGNYTIEPSDPLCPACVHLPAQQGASVSGFDVTGVDFLRQ